MKKLIILFTLIIGLSCSKDNTENNNKYDVLTGVWELYFFRPGWGYDENYNDQIYWIFDGNGNLFVQLYTSIPSDSNMPIKIEGSYNYTINLENTDLNILELGYGLGMYFENNGRELILHTGTAFDGFVLKFRKIEI